jgi:hypothetical protein
MQMNMSEEVTGVTLQVAEKAVTAGVNVTTKLAETIARLFHELFAMERERSAAKAAGKGGGAGSGKDKVKGVDLTNLKPGVVNLYDLQRDAERLKDTICTCENGVSREEMKAIAKKAKEYGIPIAFKNPKSKGSIYACVRGADLPIFKEVCAACIKDKMAQQPETLGNFKCERWEIPFLTAEMKNFDVPAMFPHSAEGAFCLYDKKDENTVRIARSQFIQKCKELETQVAIDRDEEGYYTIKDLRTGREVSFEDVPTQKMLAQQIQKQFGFDENKANMCAAKFGQEMLTDEQKQSFFRVWSQDAFMHTSGLLSLENENPLAKPYQCWYLIPKEDAKPRIVFREPESGKFAVLEPQNMSRKQMRGELTAQLGITDEKTLAALVDKADRVAFSQERDKAGLYIADRRFSLDDFKQDELVEYVHTGASGEKYSTKLKPIDSVSQHIERTGKNAMGAPDADGFEVSCTFFSTEQNEKGEPVSKEKSHKLFLSLADKKSGMHILTEMYKEQGIPEQTAKQLAKEVFQKASQQSADKVVRIEEVRSDAMTVAYGTATAEITTADKQAAASKVAAEFGVPTDTAETIVQKAEEIRADAVQQRVDALQQSKTDFATAMNRLTEREQIGKDSMIVCSASDPQKHIVVTGSHNGERVVHDYAVYNGEQKTGGYSDAQTKTPEGEPVVEPNGRHAWTNLRQEMQTQSGIGEDDVLTFASEREYRQYIEDTAFLSKSEQERSGMTDGKPEPDEKPAHGNGHEHHTAPTQTALDDLAGQGAAKKAPGGNLPNIPEPAMPDMPRPAARRR